MVKQEFLEELKSALAGSVSAEVLLDSYRYYASYIEEEIRGGKAEAEVLEELGSPSLIARSIIAADSRDRVADVEYTEDGRTRRVRRKEQAEEGKSEKAHKKFRFDFTAWYAKILYVIILILIIALIIAIISGLIWVVVTLAIPILLVLGIFYLIMFFTKSK